MFEYKDLPMPIIVKLDEISVNYNVSHLEIAIASINLIHKIFYYHELDKIENKLDRLLEKFLDLPAIHDINEGTIFDQLNRIDNKIGLMLDKIT